MNILLINGSPRKDGCTKECLLYLKKEFKISDNACCQIIDIQIIFNIVLIVESVKINRCPV